MRPVYVFDGKPPSLKAAEIERRRSAKRDAAVKYEQAVRKGDLESAKKYAQQTTAMRDEMVADAKKLLGMFGIPCVDAPSEGEAYAAHLTRQGLAHAAASQDYDSILFGATRLVRNFSLSGRRKLPNRNTYVDVEIEMISSQRRQHGDIQPQLDIYATLVNDRAEILAHNPYAVGLLRLFLLQQLAPDLPAPEH